MKNLIYSYTNGRDIPYTTGCEYETGAKNFLESTGTILKLKFTRHGLYFHTDTENRDIWYFSLENSNTIYAAEFGCSLNDTRNGLAPTAYGVLSCLDICHSDCFDDFCSEFCYDSDSRTAYDIYRQFKKQSDGLKLLFDSSELEALQEIN